MVLKDRLVLLLHQLKNHLVVLYRTIPEIGDALLALQVVHIHCLHLFLFLRLLRGLLLRKVLSVMCLKLSVVSGEISLVARKLCNLTLNDLLSDLIQRALLLEDLGFDGLDFGVEFIGEFAALV